MRFLDGRAFRYPALLVLLLAFPLIAHVLGPRQVNFELTDPTFVSMMTINCGLLLLLVRTFTLELATLEARFPSRRGRVHAVTAGIALGLAALGAIEPEARFARLLVLELGGAGQALLVVALVSAARTAVRSHAALSFRRWLLATLVAIDWLPPYDSPLDAATFWMLCAVIWISCQADLALFEERWPLRKWRIRGVALAIGLLALPGAEFADQLNHAHFFEALPPLVANLAFEFLVAAVSLLAVSSCFTLADFVAWLMRDSRSVRNRMLALGLFSSGLAFVATSATALHLAVFDVSDPNGTLLPSVSLAWKLVFLGGLSWAFAAVIARRLSVALERSVDAITSVRSGNLDVVLDESGQDEVSEVARAFNGMVAQLREAEFLEKINQDLRGRSAQLQSTLEALQVAQAELVRAERMASVATLVRGIAHELNNPIGFIAGNMAPLQRYSEFLVRVARELGDGRARTPEEVAALTRLSPKKDLRFVAQDLARMTTDISEGARRARLIISDLQGLTNAAQRGLDQVDLARVVRQTVTLLSARIPPGVRIETELQPAPPITARAGQLEQVLMNLVDNAIRAVGEKGVIRVGVRSDGGRLRISVADDGPGMTAEVKRQACEPFFTTRGPGEGSGLGLAIVASIVRGHQGTLTLHSEPGQGAEFVVELPTRPEALVAAEALAPAIESRS